MKEIQDFGGEIKGARKDLAQIRKNGGIRTEDIESWNDEERKTFITKKEVFPAPKYQEMYDSGEYSKEACFYIKQVRDSLSASPDYSRLAYLSRTADRIEREAVSEGEREFASGLRNDIRNGSRKIQNQYIDSLSYFKEELLRIKTIEDAKDVSAKLLSYCKGKDGNGENVFFTKKTLAAIDSVSSNFRITRLKKCMESKQFLCSKDDKLLSAYSIEQNIFGKIDITTDLYGENKVLKIRRDYSTSYFYENNNHDQYFDKENWMPNSYFIIDDSAKKIVSFNFDTKEKAEQYVLKYCRPPKKQATQKKKYIPTQLKQIERTGEDYLQGEPSTSDMILDTFGFYGGQFGKWESQKDRQTNLDMSFNAFKDLASALGVKDSDISLGGNLSIAYGARGTGGVPSHYETTNKVINLTKTSGAGSLCHEWAHALDHYISNELNLSDKFATNAILPKNNKVCDAIRETMNVIKYNGTYSKFYHDSLKMDKMFSKSDKGHWASNAEMFARAFACYVKDKLFPEKSDYLCGHADDGKFKLKDEIIYAYPVGEDRERINKAFDKFFDVLKEQGLFHSRSNYKDASYYQSKITEISNALNKMLDNADKLTEVDDVLNKVLILIEDYDKNGTVNTNKLFDGVLFMETHNYEEIFSVKNVLMDCFENVLHSCAEADIGNREKGRLFAQFADSVKVTETLRPCRSLS